MATGEPISKADDSDREPLVEAVSLSLSTAERWKRQIQSHYNELTETEKQSDLQQADKVLSAINLYDNIS